MRDGSEDGVTQGPADVGQSEGFEVLKRRRRSPQEDETVLIYAQSMPSNT